MARTNATRSTQRPQIAEFVINFNDWVIDSVDGVRKTFGSTAVLADGQVIAGLQGPVANTIVFDGVPMPIGAAIGGGSLLVETAVTGSTTYTVSVGTAAAPTAYLGATSALSAGRTALSLATPLASNGGQNVRLTVAYTVANATAGKIRVRVDYTIDGKADDVCVA